MFTKRVVTNIALQYALSLGLYFVLNLPLPGVVFYGKPSIGNHSSCGGPGIQRLRVHGVVFYGKPSIGNHSSFLVVYLQRLSSRCS